MAASGKKGSEKGAEKASDKGAVKKPKISTKSAKGEKEQSGADLTGGKSGSVAGKTSVPAGKVDISGPDMAGTGGASGKKITPKALSAATPRTERERTEKERARHPEAASERRVQQSGTGGSSAAGHPKPLSKEPDAESLSRKAYEIWLEEGCPDGRQEYHWGEARRRLMDN